MRRNLRSAYPKRMRIPGAKPIIQKDGYKIYRLEGSMAGKKVTDPQTGAKVQQYKDGVYEIGVNKKGIIDHRFFRPYK